MDIKQIITSQYLASLEMLRQAVLACPPEMWNDSAHKNRFWHVAYHAVFYAHIYLYPTEEDFQPWEKTRENYQFMGALPFPPDDQMSPEFAYSQADVLEYLELVKGLIAPVVASLDLQGPSGFYWLPFSKLELQFYSMRHVMQHAGELYERLGRERGLELHWVGHVPADS